MAHRTDNDTPTASIPSTEGSERRPERRPSRLLATIGALVAVLLGAGLMTSCESAPWERSAVINEVNASRAAGGLAPVVENVTLDMKADAWAQKMRDACAISHSVLRQGVPDSWQKLGENVGRGGSVGAIHVAYMNSPKHRDNIMDPAFNQMGAAAVWGMCPSSSGTMIRTLFTVHVFMKG